MTALGLAKIERRNKKIVMLALTDCQPRSAKGE